MKQSIWEEMPDDFTLEELIDRLRKSPPHPGFPRKTFRELCDEQGVGPIDIHKLMAKSPGPLYEGFEEDVRVMRRGGRARGPRR